MHRIRKSFRFEAAHQLEEAVTQECVDCIHGHSYTVEMFLASEDLGPMDMVLDFGLLREFKQWVMNSWDHGLLLHEAKIPHIQPLVEAGVLKASKVHYLPWNPTAEVMARILYMRLRDDLAIRFPDVIVERVRVHETSTGWAEAGIR